MVVVEMVDMLSLFCFVTIHCRFSIYSPLQCDSLHMLTNCRQPFCILIECSQLNCSAIERIKNVFLVRREGLLVALPLNSANPYRVTMCIVIHIDMFVHIFAL